MSIKIRRGSLLSFGWKYRPREVLEMLKLAFQVLNIYEI